VAEVSGAMTLENLRRRRLGLQILAARQNQEAIAELERVNARIDALTQTEEPLFARKPQ